MSRLHPTSQEPDMQIHHAVLNLWKNDQLEDAEAHLTAAIDEAQHPSYHLLAARALLNARLQHWDAALADAEMVDLALLSCILTMTLIYPKAINAQPSIIAYIAKSVAHVGKGEKDMAYCTCDTASEHFHSSHASFLLLMKVCIFFNLVTPPLLIPLGCHRVYGRRAPQRDIPHGRPRRYGPIQLNILYGTGM